ncbi:hypothetical protein [Flagellimonas marinaquae]|uniref:hypothetical protein n=1 Tax=Flagellimonas marinaquae TaxID=254955 RepID=UPI002075E4E7|nr:hypothetical protein [Allomuricauda aquimarina]USD24948.1 hypothetical protein MJO53_14825 [Allomuricauda aquimarina]
MNIKGPNPNKPGYSNDGKYMGTDRWKDSLESYKKGSKYVRGLYLIVAIAIIWGTYEASKSQFSGNRNGKLTKQDIEQQQKLAKELEKESYLYDAPNYSKNQLLISLEGKKIDDWALGLQNYATKNRKFDAQLYRDLADSTTIYSSYEEQERFLKFMWGLDSNGKSKLTRAHVREVKEKYSK